MTAVEFTPTELEEVRRLQGLYPQKRAALIPVLQMAQEKHGYISHEVEKYVGSLFDLAPSHVHEVVPFSPLFFQKPMGRHVIAACHNLSCHLVATHGFLEEEGVE